MLKLHSNCIQTTSKLHPNCIMMMHFCLKLHPNYIQTISKLHYDDAVLIQTALKLHSGEALYQKCIGVLQFHVSPMQFWYKVHHGDVVWMQFGCSLAGIGFCHGGSDKLANCPIRAFFPSRSRLQIEARCPKRWQQSHTSLYRKHCFSFHASRSCSHSLLAGWPRSYTLNAEFSGQGKVYKSRPLYMTTWWSLSHSHVSHFNWLP